MRRPFTALAQLGGQACVFRGTLLKRSCSATLAFLTLARLPPIRGASPSLACFACASVPRSLHRRLCVLQSASCQRQRAPDPIDTAQQPSSLASADSPRVSSGNHDRVQLQPASLHSLAPQQSRSQRHFRLGTLSPSPESVSSRPGQQHQHSLPRPPSTPAIAFRCIATPAQFNYSLLSLPMLIV